MTMLLMTVYEVFETLDKEADRGGSKSLGVFLHPNDAAKAGAGKGVLDGPGEVREVRIITDNGGKTGYRVADEGLIQVNQDGKSALRAAALSKLTPAERAELGV